MPIKSFRGLLATGTVDTINLRTLTGRTGYKIKTFKVFPEKPGTSTAESLFQIYSIKANADAQVVATSVNFSDNTLLGVGFVGASLNNTQLAPIPAIVFDNVTFNQDIFIVYKDESASSTPSNYYLELEQVKLDSNETAVATLKNIKNRG